MAKFLAVFWSFIAFLFLVACSKQSGRVVIGVSHSEIIGHWGQGLYNEMVSEFAFYDQEFDYLFEDANGRVDKQRADIKRMIDQGVSAIIVFPVNPDSISEILELAYNRGIYVVVADRMVRNAKYHSFVGTDDNEIGRMVADFIIRQYHGRASVLELMGPRLSLTSRARDAGFGSVVATHPGISIDHRLFGNWTAKESFRVVDSLMSTGYTPDFIFAHNDTEAQQAYFAAQKHGINPVIIGVDGMPDAEGGIELVLKGQIAATVYNPTAGKESIERAVSLLRGQEVVRNEWLLPFIIDSTNAVLLQRQAMLQNDQFQRIKRQRELISSQVVKIEDQRLVVYLVLALVFLLFFVVAWVLVGLANKVRLLNTIKQQKSQIEEQMEVQKELLDEISEQSQVLKEQKDEIESQWDAIYAQNQELAAYGTEMEHLVEKRTAELNSALTKARESDRLKTAFLSNLSHEIRTPLNAIAGFSELFCEPDREFEERIGLQKVIRKNTQELLSLIDRVLELSMLTTGQVSPKMKECRLSVIFERIRGQVTAFFDEGSWTRFDGVAFASELGGDVQVDTDCEKVGEMMFHLLHNAFKHTHRGNVTMGWELRDGNKTVRLFVRDTGVGIPMEYKEVIFEMFRKVESHSLELYRGAGMGLTITQHLAELLGTTISFESEVGTGSCFWFDLPARTVV